MGDSSKGRGFASGIGIYMIVKSAINLVLGFSMGNIVTLIINGVIGYGVMNGRKFFNIIASAFLAVIALMHLKGNIDGQQWFYLAEGIADLACAAALVLSKDIRSYFA